MISEPGIVQGFRATSRHALDPPANFVDDNFFTETGLVPTPGERIFQDQQERDKELQKILLSSLQRLPLVGQYSNM